MNTEGFYFLGFITKSHGIKGGLVLFLDTDEPGFYKNLTKIFIKKEGLLTPFFIETANLLPNGNLLIKLEDMDFEQSCLLLKSEVYLPNTELPPLEGNKFYYHEITNFLLLDAQNNKVGTIQSVNDQTPQALFEVVNEEGKQILIPMVDEWLLEVNKPERYIKVFIPDGLIDLYIN